MTMAAGTSQPAWTVTGQTETTQINPGGNPVRGVQVFFQTAAGHTGSVFVPYSVYTAQNVWEDVNNAASKMDEIGSLTANSGQ